MAKAQRWTLITGVVLLAIWAVALWLKIDTELKFGNVGSDPNWVAPPRTAYDRVMLHFPVAEILIGGVALCGAGFLMRRR